MSGTDLAWLAGFFDGEGCIRGRSYWKKDGRKQHCVEVTLQITQRDRGPLERCRDIVGKGSVQARSNPMLHARWELAGHRQVTTILEQLLPYSVAKREQMLVALDLMARCQVRTGRGHRVSQEELDARIGLLQKLSELKQHWQVAVHSAIPPYQDLE